MRPATRQVVTSNGATNMTGTSVVTSTPTQIGSFSHITYQCVWTGTPNGAWSVEVSNSYDPLRGTGTWTPLTITDLSTLDPAGAASDCVIELELGESWIRLKYTNASSTGSLDVWVSAKGAS